MAAGHPTVPPDGEPRRIVYHVDGVNGEWTQAFDWKTVDMLVRMGLIVWLRTTSNDTWMTYFYGPSESKTS